MEIELTTLQLLGRHLGHRAKALTKVTFYKSSEKNTLCRLGRVQMGSAGEASNPQSFEGGGER